MDASAIAAKRKQYRELREQALAITDKALAEDRQLTADEQTTLGAAVEKAKKLHSEIDGAKLGMAPELLKSIIDANAGNDPDDPHMPGSGDKAGTTLGVKAEPPHPWATAIQKTCEAYGQKAFGMPTGSVPLPSLATTPVSMGQLGAPLVQAIGLTPWPADGGRAVQYLRQTGRTNRAAIWKPGAAPDGSDTTAKPISDYITALVQADVATIAHLASPVSALDLADFPQLDQWVSSELVFGVGQALEDSILNAAGPEPAFTGLLTLPGTTPVPFNANGVPETIMDGAVTLANLGYGDGLSAVLSPDDWSSIALMKSTQGEYLFPTLPAAAATPSLFGIKIVVSPHMPAGTAILANLRASVALYEREQPQVIWGTINDQFSKNLISARGEGRFALTTPQPAAVGVVDLSATAVARSSKK